MEIVRKHFLQLFLFDPAWAIVSRTGARAIIGSLNASMIGMIGSHLRAQRIGTPLTPQNGEERFSLPGQSIDSRNTQDTEIDGEALEQLAQADNGHSHVPEKPLIIAARMKLVREVLAEDLAKHAGKRNDFEGREIDDPFHVAQPMAETMKFMSGSSRVNEAVEINEELKALGVSKERVIKAREARAAQGRAYLRQNADEILSIYGTLIAADGDGFLITKEQWLTCFDKLPILTRVRLAAGSDRALYNAFDRELVSYERGGLLAVSNMALLDATRREVRLCVKDWMSAPGATDEYRGSLERFNTREPDWMPEPAKVQPTAAETLRRSA